MQPPLPLQPAPPVSDAAAARLAALQARGAAQADPVGWAYAQALARRTAAHDGATRQWLDQRLAQALDTLSARCDAAAATPATPPPEPPAPAPLTALLQHLQTLSPAPVPATTPQAAAPGAVELKTVQRHRSTWARLSADQQLARALAQVPDNPGPLNSHRLVLRALQRLQETAPAYLQQLLVHAETLLWLEQANAGSAPAAARPPRAGRPPSSSSRSRS
jgi:hypothetical protein